MKLCSSLGLLEIYNTRIEDENKENILNGVVSINEGIIEYLKHVPFIMAETGIVKGTLFTINPPLYVRYSAINPP